MTQAIDVIRDALGYLRVIDPDMAPEASDIRDAIRQLNMMMTEWEAQEIPMGWQNVSLPTDVLPTPLEADGAIGLNLALKLRFRYGVALDSDLMSQATDSLGLMRAMVASSTYDRIHYPDLPRGDAQPNVYGWRAAMYI